MEVVTIYKEISEENIFAPKPKRLFPKNKKQKKSKSSRIKNVHQCQFDLLDDLKSDNTKEINLDSISVDEIEKDFKDLDEKTEEKICYEELSNILLSSSEESLSDNKTKKNDIIKRPKRPFIGNVQNF